MPRYVNNAGFDVAVIGLGYVGLPAALMLAKNGLKVAGIDIDARRIDAIRSGSCPLNEEGITEIFRDPKAKANLSVSTDVPVADAYLIAVPTPLHHRKKNADLTALLSAVKSIIPVLRKGSLIIVESTIPPLTCREEVTPVLESTGLKIGHDIYLAHCPERLFPGNVAHEIIHNDRIVGGSCKEATRRSCELYGTFVKGKLLETDELVAEFCKLMENAYRDVNIALANEMDLVAEKLGVSIHRAIELANHHPRVNFLRPGIGVGGHCIPIDPWFLTEVAPERMRLIPTARQINDGRPDVIASRIRKALSAISNPKLAVYGVTYKPNVNDQRESPAWEVIKLLQKDGYEIEVFDPVAHVGEAVDFPSFVQGKDALVVLVEHEEVIPHLQDRPKLLRLLRSPIILRF